MTLVMAYVILIAAGISAAAAVLEAFARGRGLPARWVWVAALGFTTAATAFAMFAPIAAPVPEEVIIEPLRSLPAMAAVRTAPTLPVRPTLDVTGMLARADRVLPFAWLTASALLLIALGIGRQRYQRERALARKTRVGGHDVLLTEDVGPAVAGVRRPVVFVPRWVLALDEASQQLLLSHELEHVKKRDTSLLLLGAVTIAITPWNPAVWWMVRRLRLAVEQDCDARVLAQHPGIRRYADLLLTAASRHGLAARLLAAHFGEYTSDLVRRIEAMTNVKQLSWRKIGSAAFVAVTVVAVACETPRPDPVAPVSLKSEAPAASPARSAEFSAQVERCSPSGGAGCSIAVIVKSSDGKELQRYADEIPVAELPQNSIHKINVENANCGASECSLVWITLKPDASLKPLRIEQIEPKKEYLVERKKEETELPVDRSVQVPPKLLKGAPTPDSMVEVRTNPVQARVLQRDGERVANGTGTVEVPARLTLRRNDYRYAPTNLAIQTEDGIVLKRIAADKVQESGRAAFDEINADDIAAIEVYKGNSCGAQQPMACPLIKITIKRGREGRYTKR